MYIEKNEKISKLLEIEGVPHEVLNAKAHEREGQIIAQAGRFGAVTVATNMAGRGVDIVLGGNPPDEIKAAKVREAGGLAVLGTERHEARRIDNQLRGRAGRQGDPGASQFFVSLEDDLIRVFGGDKLQGILKRLHMPEDQPIESGMVSNAIESAQSKIEGFNFDTRKHLLDYDDVLNKHRDAVYKKRGEILEKNQEALSKEVKELVQRFGFSLENYEAKEKELGKENMQNAERIASLRAIDTLWVEHLENMEALRDSVRLRAYGQQDPLVEYKNVSHKMFQDLLSRIDTFIANSIMQARLTTHQHTHPHVAPAASNTPKNIGRNDPCYCGAVNPATHEVYKYKKCGLINASYHKKS